MSTRWRISARSQRFTHWSSPARASCLIGILLLGFALPLSGQEAAKAVAPKYDAYPLSDAYKDANARKEKKRIKDEILKGAGSYNKQEVDGYYRGFVLPLLTFVTSPDYANLARREILEDIDRSEKASDTVMNEFNAMLYAEMRKIAEGNYQPSAGIIATQILGRLNKSRAKGSIAAEPLTQAVGPLLALSENGKNDGIRAAALAGLERHIDFYAGTWPDANRQVLADRLLALLKADRPAHRSIRSDAWLRGRTIELLLKLKHAKEAELYQYALDVLADPKTDPILIEKAMLVMGHYPAIEVPPTRANPALANSLKLLVAKVNAWKKEAGEAQFQGSSDDSESIDMSGDDGSAVTDDGSGDEGMIVKKKKKPEPKLNPYAKQAADVIAKRRALHEPLEVIRYGFTGSKTGDLPSEPKLGLALLAAEGENRQVVMEILTALKDLQDVINSPTIADRMGLVNEVTPKADSLLGTIEFYLSGIEEAAAPEAPGAPATPAAPVVDVTVAP